MKNYIVIETILLNYLYRQIADFSKRIVNYAEEGMQVIQGTDAGFIKFGSSDLFFLPLGLKLMLF
jgi:phosphatidylserine decarboxylase